jgi:hypothetical protein
VHVSNRFLESDQWNGIQLTPYCTAIAARIDPGLPCSIPPVFHGWSAGGLDLVSATLLPTRRDIDALI